MNKPIYIEEKNLREIQETNNLTRLKSFIIEREGSFNEEVKEDLAQLIFATKLDVIRLAEEDFDDDIRKLKELAQYYSTSIDYLLDLTDDPNPYPQKNQ